ncbi:similar to Saccharomyces cerevisiae YAL031C GIP4 Cytoplasmic Glc7-interacting protein whose overexpression relocalizes Glc7p from the nucleus and prevents chromosome segregation [Maudiozyma barnettii]|uniref:Similar to Saccharomyces cerevisiae YAL031C GIP4 Cytoplasmic Glc7-interacting protein whose overexpression relocalizes Glc7p from the nucleus and prevents chromosome segregation n=1 Tax=Maudiozyma barnettii TaxID=61262 RepID=A0A8H2ZKM3_9SACH|nr:protein phosphatase regulator GIP4 [Kazachstania barnettii]CAB4255322.1 similar to Saccharomyces cerevisiae YAL031C GIP4 Cytoplasmic Glc7-interacting protein whose overexpression relocalizes Glc7p from the nucleus and prevents chromosome segregation [Kazachstania barnettii]CAD1783728.1 similar to Saccharomyces cerevisiae YAL031C GIP4 Cytoplasmic Glc7-interacting protein whose overexpression relocalizes Glc7p from the nucleus and prevents chromosome segregation [Kazachstania barnettii]
MHTKAAALAATGSLKAPMTLDTYDVKIIQYKTALFKLQELQRLLSILEKNLKNDERNKIIPLINYILIICDGPTFNVSQIIRKRYKLLCEHKICKTNDIGTQLSTHLIELRYSLSEIIGAEDYQGLRENVYSIEKQWELFDCLKRISNYSITIYNKKVRQLLLERNSTINRPYEVSDFKEKQFNNGSFDFTSVEDIIKPNELALSLDLAVLINDREKDTSQKSFLKLQYQVLTKFNTHMNKKVFPPLRSFYIKLQKYNNIFSKNETNNNQNEATEILPHFRFGLHRIYALMFRSYSVSCIIRSMSREIYLTNRTYFLDPITKLLTGNLFEFEDLLSNLDNLYTSKENQKFNDIVSILEELSKNGIKYEKTNSSDTFTVLYNDSINRTIHFIRSQLLTIIKLQEHWKTITENLHLRDSFDGMGVNQINKMLNEKRSVDQLAYTEKTKTILKTKGNKETILYISSSSTSSKTPSANVTPLLSSLNMSNEEITPIDLKKKFYHSKSSSSSNTGSQLNVNGTKSPISLSRRASMDKGSRTYTLAMSPLSKTSSPRHNNELSIGSHGIISPQISRRSSIIATARNSQYFVETDGYHSPSRLESSTNGKQTRKAAVRGRPRSTSLQSSFSKGKTRISAMSSPDPQPLNNLRSNSLETSGALNRLIIQDAAKKSMKIDGHAKSAKTMKSPPLIRQNRSRSGSASKQQIVNGINQERNPNTPSKSNLGVPMTSPLTRKRSNLSQEVIPDIYIENDVSVAIRNKPEALQFSSSGNVEDNTVTEQEGIELIKKVRFTGVPPMSPNEDPKPRRKGWYKKPAQLHYPPAPPQIRLLRNRLTQEGVAFRTSLRENYQENTTENFDNAIPDNQTSNRRSTMFFNADGELNNPFKETIGRKFASKIRNSLRS